MLLIVVMVFGTKKLRNMGQDLGGAVKGFKDGMKDGNEAENKQVTESSALDSKPTIDVDAKEKR